MRKTSLRVEILKNANREMVISRTTPVLKVNLLIRLWLNTLKIFITTIPENGAKKPGA